MVWRTSRIVRSSASSRGRSGSGLAILCAALLGLAGCGGSDDDDEEEEKKPDSGYGTGQPVPSSRSCIELCLRLGDCAARLCNEDSDSTRYDALEEFLVSSCESSCSESLLQSELTDEQWQCLFESSCREVFDYDECRADGSYYCN